MNKMKNEMQFWKWILEMTERFVGHKNLLHLRVKLLLVHAVFSVCGCSKERLFGDVCAPFGDHSAHNFLLHLQFDTWWYLGTHCSWLRGRLYGGCQNVQVYQMATRMWCLLWNLFSCMDSNSTHYLTGIHDEKVFYFYFFHWNIIVLLLISISPPS